MSTFPFFIYFLTNYIGLIRYYLGFPGHEVSSLSINGTRNFINTGVILINLKLLREINSLKLIENYYKSHGTKKVDEYLINVVFYNKISCSIYN